MVKIFKFLSCRWKANNVEKFSESNCYKIHCADPEDDVIHHYASQYVGIAGELASHEYNSKIYHNFWLSLKFIFETERELYSSLLTQQRQRATDEMLTAIDITEELLDMQGSLESKEDKF